MLGGGVAGGVGFLMGPWASAAFGGGLRGSLIAVALEGSLTDGAMQITVNWASGRTWHHNLGWSLLGGAAAGGVGGGIGWWWLYPRKEIQLISFQGVSPRNWDRLIEANPLVATDDLIIDDLAMYGHTGLSFDQGHMVFGFRPSDTAMELPNIDDIIRESGEVPGQVFDDTDAFVNAHRLSLMNIMEGRTQPYYLSTMVSKARFERVRRTVMAQVEDPTLTQRPYRFPVRDKDGNPLPMPIHCDNCTTWANRLLANPVPEYTGQLRDFIPRFKQRGAIPWVPPSS